MVWKKFHSIYYVMVIRSSTCPLFIFLPCFLVVKDSKFKLALSLFRLQIQSPGPLAYFIAHFLEFGVLLLQKSLVIWEENYTYLETLIFWLFSVRSDQSQISKSSQMLMFWNFQSTNCQSTQSKEKSHLWLMGKWIIIFLRYEKNRVGEKFTNWCHQVMDVIN